MSVQQTLSIAKSTTRPSRNKLKSSLVLRYDIGAPKIKAGKLARQTPIICAASVLSFESATNAFRTRVSQSEAVRNRRIARQMAASSYRTVIGRGTGIACH